jgi:hypothetical protein
VNFRGGADSRRKVELGGRRVEMSMSGQERPSNGMVV